MDQGGRSDRWSRMPVASGGSVALHALLLVAFIAAGSIRFESLGEPQVKQPIMREFLLPVAPAAGPPLSRGRQAAEPEGPRGQEPEAAEIPEVIQPAADPPTEPVEEADAAGAEEGPDAGGEEGVTGGMRGGVREGSPWGVPDGVIGGGAGSSGHGIGGEARRDFHEEEPVHLTDEVRPPERLAFVKPEYPEVARKARVSGKVILQVVVGRTGEIEQVTVLRSDPLFDRAAIDAVRRWRYRPALQGGQPVKVYMTVIVEFGLT
jgi:protein TonB